MLDPIVINCRIDEAKLGIEFERMLLEVTSGYTDKRFLFFLSDLGFPFFYTQIPLILYFSSPIYEGHSVH